MHFLRRLNSKVFWQMGIVVILTLAFYVPINAEGIHIHNRCRAEMEVDVYPWPGFCDYRVHKFDSIGDISWDFGLCKIKEVRVRIYGNSICVLKLFGNPLAPKFHNSYPVSLYPGAPQVNHQLYDWVDIDGNVSQWQELTCECNQ